MSDLLLRPRSAMEIVDATFRLYRLQFGVIAAIALLILGPFALLSAVVGGSLGALIDRASGLFMPVVSGATVLVVANVLHDVAANVSGTFAQLRGRWGALIQISVMQNLLIIIGLLVLVVPGVLALVWTFAAPMIVAVEGRRDSGTAFDRARQLARGQFWHILGTVLLSGLVTLLLFMSAMFAFGLLLGLTPVGENATGILSKIAFILLFPVFAVSNGLLYFDLRIRTEAYDVERLAQILDAAPVVAQSQHD